IEVFCARHPEVVYFPSYEMVARSPRWAYDKDNWHVSDPAVIGRIMSAFMSGFGEAGADASVEAKDAAQSAGAA
ncbi:MAG: GSCFA domain-containing protein, partial [Phycisphaerales bacterium]|nr:GSCFA domain-containing protein [Phycisphaerales bacterium]